MNTIEALRAHCENCERMEHERISLYTSHLRQLLDDHARLQEELAVEIPKIPSAEFTPYDWEGLAEKLNCDEPVLTHLKTLIDIFAKLEQLLAARDQEIDRLRRIEDELIGPAPADCDGAQEYVDHLMNVCRNNPRPEQ